MKTKRNLLAIFVLIVSAQFCFAVSPKAQLSKQNERMFWVINGTDKNGNPSAVYIQGTIHIGDDRLYPLADAVLDAWENADCVMGEISSVDMASLQTAVQRDMFASYRRAKGKNLYDFLNEDELAVLYTLIDGSQFDAYGSFEPWVLNSVLSTLSYSDSGLDGSLGLDQKFLAMADEDGRIVEGLDTLRTQLDVLEFGTYDEQLLILKQTLSAFIEDSDDSDELLARMYEAYLADDADALAEIVSIESSFGESEEEVALTQAYMKALFTDRNQAWAEKIATLLAEGGTTFIFAGAGHFVGENSVFAFLKKNGTIR